MARSHFSCLQTFSCNELILSAKIQVLRDEIGTAMTNKKSRADQFSLIIHGQEGEGEAKEAFLEKEVQRYV